MTELTEQQRRVIALLLHTDDDFEEASQKVGVSVETIKSWKELPEFREAMLAELALMNQQEPDLLHAYYPKTAAELDRASGRDFFKPPPKEQ